MGLRVTSSLFRFQIPGRVRRFPVDQNSVKWNILTVASARNENISSQAARAALARR